MYRYRLYFFFFLEKNFLAICNGNTRGSRCHEKLLYVRSVGVLNTPRVKTYIDMCAHCRFRLYGILVPAIPPPSCHRRLLNATPQSAVKRMHATVSYAHLHTRPIPNHYTPTYTHKSTMCRRHETLLTNWPRNLILNVPQPYCNVQVTTRNWTRIRLEVVSAALKINRWLLLLSLLLYNIRWRPCTSAHNNGDDPAVLVLRLKPISSGQKINNYH